MNYIINYPEDKDTKFEQFRYPAGEEQVRFKKEELEKIVDADEVFVIARINSSVHMLGLMLLTDALDNLNESKHTLVLPYLPYSRADRRFTEGDCNGLKTFGRFIDDLAYDRVVTMDVHNPVAAKKFISNLICLSPLPFIRNVLSTLPENTVILLPDEGAKRYGLEKEFLDVYYCTKNRDEVTGKILGFTVPEEVKHADNVLIVDDICDGGATFLGIAEELSGAEHKYLYITHGIFSKGITELAPRFKRIFTTDSFNTSASFAGYTERILSLPVQGMINKEIMDTSDIWETACQSS